MSDYIVMIKERSKVFLGGPPLVKMATGEESDDESLGGAEMHARVSGLADYFAVDELDGIRLGRQVVRRLNHRKRGAGPTRRRSTATPRPRAAARHRLAPIRRCRSIRATSSPGSSTTATSTSSSRCTARRWSPASPRSTAIPSASSPTTAACCSARRPRRPRSSSSSPTRSTRRWCSCRTPPATWSARSSSSAASSRTAPR